jgi:hypothetical protein
VPRPCRYEAPASSVVSPVTSSWFLKWPEERQVVVARRAEVERVVVADVERVVHAARQLGEPGQRREPRRLEPRVLEAFLTDRVRDRDRRLDERKRVRVEQRMLAERAAELPELELERGDVRGARPDLLGVDGVL